MSILIVDDSLDIRLLLKCILEVAGYEGIIAVDSAAEAFRVLGIDPPDGGTAEQIDLILMDSMMPKMDGIETCRKIKAVEKYKDVPIIMVTARTEKMTVENAFEAGVSDYVMKPLEEVDLLERVRTAIAMKKQRANQDSL